MSTTYRIMDRLRTETRNEHIQTERTALSQAMVRGTLTVKQHWLQLYLYAHLLDQLEHRIEHGALGSYQTVWEPQMRKLPSLRLDLRELEHTQTPVPRPVTIAMVMIGQRLYQDALNPARLLGWLYVFEGSTLGAEFLARRLAQHVAELQGRGLNYYRVYGSQTRARWSAFGERMNRCVPPEAEPDVVAGARRAFKAVRDAFAAILQATSAGSVHQHAPSSATPLPGLRAPPRFSKPSYATPVTVDRPKPTK